MKMIPKSLTSSDWDVLKLKSDNGFVKDSSYSKRISFTGAKRKQSNINDFLMAVGSKLSDSKGPYTEMVFKPSSTSTPNAGSKLEQPERMQKSRSLQRGQRQLDFPKQRSFSTGNLPALSRRKAEALDVLDQILLEQETLTIKKYLLNNSWVKVLVLEDTEL